MTDRAKKLKKMIPINYDRFLYWCETREFCVFVVSVAGDTLTYRIYDDGRVFAG